MFDRAAAAEKTKTTKRNSRQIISEKGVFGLTAGQNLSLAYLHVHFKNGFQVKS